MGLERAANVRGLYVPFASGLIIYTTVTRRQLPPDASVSRIVAWPTFDSGKVPGVEYWRVVRCAITGIAGLGGGKQKPVGLVHFAAASRDGRLLAWERRYATGCC